MWSEENRTAQRKTLRAGMSQSRYDINDVKLIRATVVGGECLQHRAIPSFFLYLLEKGHKKTWTTILVPNKNIPEIQSNQHSEHHQSGVKLWWKTQSDQSDGSGWCKLASQCPSYDGRCHRWLHCPPWRHSQNVPGWCELSEWSCRVPPLLLQSEELGKWRTPVWISCHNQQTDAP